jgi:hypothetical protein
MSNISLGKAVLEITTDLAHFDLKGASKDLQGFTGLSKESMLALKQGAAAALAGVAALGAGVVALGMRGAVVGDVRREFGLLSEKVGETSDVMLGALRKGTVGTVSDFELMKMANKALGAGFKGSAADMETLASGARLLAKRVGGDTATAFETLTKAIATGRMASVAELGLTGDKTAALQKYAEAHGTTVGALTKAQQTAALAAAVVGDLKGVIADAGDQAADFGERIAAGRNHLTNFSDSLAVAIADSPVVAAGMDSIAAAVAGAFGASQESLVKTLIGWVNEFAIKLTYLGDAAVLAGRVLSVAFTGVKVLIASVGTAATFVIESIITHIGQLLNAATQLPLVGGQFKSMAAAVENARVFVNGMRKDYQSQVSEAIQGGIEQQEALSGVSQTIGTVRAAMIAAKDATVEQAASARELATELETVAGSAGKATAAIAPSVPLLQALGKEFQALGAAVETNTATWVANNSKVAVDFKRLQEEITLANKTGIDRRLMEIDLARQNEIAGLAMLKATHAKEYAEIVALVNQKYQQMVDTATGANQTMVDRAREAGFVTRAELEATAATALATYQHMLESGLFTTAELQRAWEAAETAKKAASEDTRKFSTDQYLLMSQSASSILGSLFGKSKAAAIASAVIDTAAAIVKTFKQYGWPAGIIPAAAMGAAGAAQIAKIKSTNAGFRMGTPDLDFLNFGPESTVNLHGDEAVIPRGAGKHELAGEIAEGLLAHDRGGAVSDRPIEITVISKLDGRKVAENQVRYIPDRLAFAGILS